MFLAQDAGTFLCVIDDSNEHMLSVWDWNRNTKIVEVKVWTCQDDTHITFSPLCILY